MILCCGEALIDMIDGDGAFTPHVGGAVFNTARALGPTTAIWPYCSVALTV